MKSVRRHMPILAVTNYFFRRPCHASHCSSLLSFHLLDRQPHRDDRIHIPIGPLFTAKSHYASPCIMLDVAFLFLSTTRIPYFGQRGTRSSRPGRLYLSLEDDLSSSFLLVSTTYGLQACPTLSSIVPQLPLSNHAAQLNYMFRQEHRGVWSKTRF